jgi:hydroxypyruvate isomerase
MDSLVNRRALLRGSVAAALGVSSLSALAAGVNSFSSPSASAVLKGNIQHSVVRGTYGFLSLDELCMVVKQLGFSAIDLVGPNDWPTLKRHGVDSSMCSGAELNLVDGWGNSQFHKPLIESYRKYIDLVGDAGYKNLICFSGNKRGNDPEEGLKIATKGLKKILAQAEKRGVILQMELFNSKVDHPDYFADNSAWGIELCKRLDSPNFKLLYDIYHMQISEGDIIRTIQNNHQYFGHYHTAGVPGRKEIDDSQELYYPAIARAIHATGFKGYVAQEFTSKRTTNKEKIESLQAAINLCDI